MTEIVTEALTAKVLAAAKVAGYVQKSGRNTIQNYNFAGDEAITEKFREAMLEQGVLVFPSGGSELVSLNILEREGKAPQILVTLKRPFTVTDGITAFTIEAWGQGADTGDKAIYKALTGSKKYAYRELVMMVTGDDPEAAREDEARSTNQPVSQSVKQQSNGNADAPASAAQKRLIQAKAAEANLSKEGLANLRLSVTGKRSSKDFTNADIDKMLAAFNDPAQLAAAQVGGTVTV